MRGRGLHRLGTRAGQFFIWRFLDGPGWSRGHPLSLAAAPTGDELVVSARLVGDGTARLRSLRPGTRVVIEGPLGHLTGERRTRSTLLMLGAGTGIAPLVALLESEPYAPGDAVLVTRDHAPGERVRTDAIARLVAERGLVHYALDGPRSHGASSWLPARHEDWPGPELLRRLAPDLDACDVYVCGPTPWMRSLRADLRAAGVPASRIHRESFTM